MQRLIASEFRLRLRVGGVNFRCTLATPNGQTTRLSRGRHLQTGKSDGPQPVNGLQHCM